MKKLGVLLLILLIPLAMAVGGNETKIEKAYSCLEKQLETKNSFALEEGVFGLLSLGEKEKLKQSIESQKNTNCWPSPSCKLEDTAKVLLAYLSINEPTDAIESYLILKNASATGLTWFLMIDIEQHVPATCAISYQGSSHTIDINDNMKLSGNPGGCLSIDSSGYWLEVRQDCLDKKFEISCDGTDFSNFITTLFYKKSGSNAIYISPNTHSAPTAGTTEEEISARCFKTASSCDYEGSLWTALALQEAGKDISPYIPYLTALAEDNQKFFPDAFLHILTGRSGTEHYTKIIDSQIQERYWQAPNTANNRFYDTALALLAFQGVSSTEADNARAYLLETQTPDGCWNNNNFRDTAFLLYAGWSTQTTPGAPPPSTGGSPDCETEGNYCGSFSACTNAGGDLLNDYDCPVIGEYCCSAPLIEQTCTEKGGVICPAGKQCAGASTTSLEGSCCLDFCEDLTAPPTTNECESQGGSCYPSSCTKNEEELSAACTISTDFCCKSKTTTPSEEGSSLWIWITLLIILIILVVLGIVFRKKLQVLKFKFKKRKGGIKTSPAHPKRPPSFGPPIRPMSQRPRPVGAPPARQPRPQRKRPSKIDKEMEETLRKLREIGK